MRYSIDVDQEVFDFLRKHMTSFEREEPNRVLKLFLPLSEEKTPAFNLGSVPDNRPVPELPVGIPTALEHILRVTSYVRIRGTSRQQATKLVATEDKVAVQTVTDKYGRQLGLQAREFDRLLASSDPGPLESVLVSKFPEFSAEITAWLKHCWHHTLRTVNTR